MKIFTGLILSLICFASEAGPHIVFVLGEREYKTLETVPVFFEKELKPAGYTATFVTAADDEASRNDFSGLAEAMKSADICFVSVRRRAPAKADMDALKNHVAEGKPLVAIRTSSHAFHLRGKPAPEGHDLWEEFDPAILGGNYNGHYKSEPATVTVAKGAENHPVFKGVGKLPVTDKLYKAAPLAKSTTRLLDATIEGQPTEPVAWTHSVGEKEAKIFYTSLGQTSDFADAEFRKFLKNAIDWAAQK